MPVLGYSARDPAASLKEISLTAQDPTLFLGSSSEGLAVAENLQSVLDDYCEATVWNQGTFGLSGTGIVSLIQAAKSYDFAVLVLTADDLVSKRGHPQPTARDNVLFEAGLFIGAIGLERTILVSCRDDDLALPSDLDGVTRATYRKRADKNLRSALNPTGLKIRERIGELGLRRGGAALTPNAVPTVDAPSLTIEEEAGLLQRELSSLSTSAEAQGWTVKTHSDSAYRLVAPDGLRFSLSIGDPHQTRRELRPYAIEVSEYGLRLSRSLVTPVGEPVNKAKATRARERKRTPPKASKGR